MFKNMFDKFDDFDMDKVMKTADLVWDNREKIMHLIETLPELLKNTGDSIESAGDSAVQASMFLTGDDDTPGAGEISALAADALENCFKEIQSVAQVMGGLGRELDKVKIPSFKPKFTEVLGMNVMSGVDLGEDDLLDNAADRLQDGSARLREIGKDLNTVAKHLRALGGTLDEAGGDINRVGVQLKRSGGQLRSLME